MFPVDPNELNFTDHALLRARERLNKKFNYDFEIEKEILRLMYLYNDSFISGDTIYFRISSEKEELYAIVDRSDLVITTIMKISEEKKMNLLLNSELSPYSEQENEKFDQEDELEILFDGDEIYGAAKINNELMEESLLKKNQKKK